MTAILNHSRVTASGASPDQWLYFLHAIYGSGRNWGTVARRLVDDRPEWGAVLVDLRLHGGSEGFSPPHTVAACANDVLELQQNLALPATAILGHSFGGKVALLAAERTDSPPRQVWVADSTLRTGEPAGSAWRVIEVVRGLPDRFSSREELAEGMMQNGYARGVGLWLGMNLERDGDEFRWKLDWNGVEEMLRDYFSTDVWSIIENPPAATALHVIQATQSNAIDDESARRLADAGERTGRVHLHRVEGTHWLNVDNPEAILDLLTAQLP